MKHETAAGQFIELVNARCAQGHDYTDSWQFVRRNNPDLYRRMSTEGAPKADLGNSANASEIARLRAVISRESKIAVDLANGLMVKCNYPFEKAWAETKIFNKDVHARIADAHRQVQQLVNAKPAAPAAQPVDHRLVETDLKGIAESVWGDERVAALLGEFAPPQAAGRDPQNMAITWAAHCDELPPKAYAGLIDIAAELAASLYDGDKGLAREAVLRKYPNIARAAEVGVKPVPDAAMAKALGRAD